MDVNPYQAPQESGYEPPEIPDGETFNTTRLFFLMFSLMVFALLLAALGI